MTTVIDWSKGAISVKKGIAVGAAILAAIVMSLILFGGSAITDRGNYRVDSRFVSENAESRIQLLVVHYTAADLPNSIRLLTKGDVSSHYLIPEYPELSDDEPIALQLVPEDKRAWHAGESYWNGRRNLNDTSIGIEIVNMGYRAEGSGLIWYPYSEPQIELVTKLAKDIIQRNGIAPENVVGHMDISPQRKKDPGPLFPWKSLAEQGIGAWPDPQRVHALLAGRLPTDPVDILSLQQKLALYGYEIDQDGVMTEKTKNVISAFQMHFRQSDYSGIPDAETEAIAEALIEKYRPLR